MSSQHAIDDMTLSVWAGAGNRSIKAGYEAVARKYRLSDRQARKRVHLALERQGINPHTGPTLVNAWVKMSRVLVRGGDLV